MGLVNRKLILALDVSGFREPGLESLAGFGDFGRRVSGMTSCLGFSFVLAFIVLGGSCWLRGVWSFEFF